MVCLGGEVGASKVNHRLLQCSSDGHHDDDDHEDNDWRMKEDTNLPDESIAQLGDSCEGVAPQLQPVPQAKIVRGTNFPALGMEGEDDVGGGNGHILVNPLISWLPFSTVCQDN